MTTAGIVAEYNPFHNGHRYHIEKTKEETGADTIVAVMSGNFLQRGIPALADKWERAQAACLCGADLVLELPFLYAVNDASVFAKGAIGILEGLGCVDCISFGSESADLGLLRNIAALFASETPEFREKLQKELKNGNSYPKARAMAAEQCLGSETAEILSKPNNILAIEYLKQLEAGKSTMKPFAVRRMGDYFDRELAASDENENKATASDETERMQKTGGTLKFSSATAIRESLLENGDLNMIRESVPSECFQVLQRIDSDFKHRLNDFRKLIAAAILRSGEEELAGIYACSEGLENRLKEAVRRSSGVAEMLDDVVTKRYTKTRIQRLFLQIVTGMRRDIVTGILEEDIVTARVLAANEKGRALLRRAKKEELAKIPVVTACGRNFEKVQLDMFSASQKEKALELLRFDALASDIYNLVYGRDMARNSDFVRKPFML